MILYTIWLNITTTSKKMK